MKRVIFSGKQVEENFGVKFINCNRLRNTLYRYMPISRVMEMLRTKEICAVYPILWNDPYESKYLETDYTRLGYSQPKIYCICFRNDVDNEEASWKIYADGVEPTIRVSFKANILFNVLNNFAKENHCKLYLSNAIYDHSREEINNLHEESSTHFTKYFKDFSEEKYLTIMSIKRKAFKYENELRIFLVPQDKEFQTEFGTAEFIKIPIHRDLFSTLFIRFIINPFERINDDSDKKELKMAAYLAQFREIKKGILNVFPKADVLRSILYEECERIKKI